MEKVNVMVEWCDNNFGATFGEEVPGAVVLTAKTFDELQKEAEETLRFHIDGMLEDGDDVPRWLADGDYELVYHFKNTDDKDFLNKFAGAVREAKLFKEGKISFMGMDELMASIEEGRQQIRNGQSTLCRTQEELDNLFSSL